MYYINVINHGVNLVHINNNIKLCILITILIEELELN